MIAGDSAIRRALRHGDMAAVCNARFATKHPSLGNFRP